MSYSWAGMSNNMFPYSSSKQKKRKEIHIRGNYAGSSYLPFEKQIQCLHNQACMQKDFSYSREVNSRETSPWGGFPKTKEGLDLKT